MNGGTYGNVADRQGVPDTDGRILSGNNGITRFKTARRNDIAAFAIGITYQRNVRGAVGIVFQPLNPCGDIIFMTAEINNTIVFSMTAPPVTDGNTTVVVTTRAAAFLF